MAADPQATPGQKSGPPPPPHPSDKAAQLGELREAQRAAVAEDAELRDLRLRLANATDDLEEVARERDAALAETRAVRDGYQALCGEFGPSAQSGMSARISLTMLNRHRVTASLPALPRTPGAVPSGLVAELNAEIDRYRRERDEAREQVAEVRRIACQGGQDAASVRQELLGYLEGGDDERC